MILRNKLKNSSLNLETLEIVFQSGIYFLVQNMELDNKSPRNEKDENINQRNNGISTHHSGERVVLNIGGTRFETFVSTLTKYPNSLLGAMFHPRNSHLRKPDI